MKPHFISFLAGFFLIIPFSAGSEVVFDGTMGPAGNAPGSPNFTIAETAGTRTGNNLFHSFSSFNLSSAESATFTGSATIRNVISRVTGGGSTTIDGFLTSTIGNADFFFINPAGVIFGPSAWVNVPASFHVSTANSLIFRDGTQFSASDPGASTLTVASPEAFGFTGESYEKIQVNRSLLLLQPDSTLSLVGGDVHLDSALMAVQGGEARLIANGPEAGVIPVSGNDLERPGDGLLHFKDSEVDGQDSTAMFLSGGEIYLNKSNIYHSTTGTGSDGSITLQGHDLILDNGSRISGVTDTTTRSAGINIQLENRAILTGESYISSESSKGGDGGDISVSLMGPLEMHDGAMIFSSNLGDGNGGNISLAVEKGVDLTSGAQIYSNTAQGTPVPGTAPSGGRGGDITINTMQSINLSGDSVIFSSTSQQGDGGALDVEAFHEIYLSEGSLIFSNTSMDGNSGAIRVEADSIGIDGELGVSGIVSEALAGTTGHAGDVEVDAGNKIQVLHGGIISSNTFGAGNAGSVQVRGADILLDGSRSSLVTGISSEAGTGSTGEAGEVDIMVSGPLKLLDGGVVSSSTWGEGDAGRVSIQAEEADVEGLGRVTGITTQSNRGASGDAGSINIEIARKLSIKSEGSISSSTQASGNAGSVEISAGEIEIDGSNSDLFTGIESRAERGASGSVGNISVTTTNSGEAGPIRLMNDGRISIAHYGSSGSGNSGEQARISVNAGQLELTGESRITSESTGNVPAANIDIHASNTFGVKGLSRVSTESNRADAGDITIVAGPYTYLRNGLITTSVGGSTGDGGDIDISTPILIMYSGFIQANTQGIDGRGGAISIDANHLICSYGTVEIGGGAPREFMADAHTNIIQAAAPSGIPGDIEISVPVTDITGSLLPLNSDFSDLAEVEAVPCKVEPGSTPSSLTWAGRGGLPPSASDPLSIPLGDRCDDPNR